MASMRDRMPTCAGWIDELRDAFGVEDVNAWVREGLKAGSFYAQEAGHTVGKPQPRGGYVQAFVLPLPKRKGA